MYACQAFFCVTDLQTSRETKQLSLIVSVFVCHYSCSYETLTFPIFFYFIQSEERTSTPWGGKGGEGDDKEL